MSYVFRCPCGEQVQCAGVSNVGAFGVKHDWPKVSFALGFERGWRLLNLEMWGREATRPVRRG
jgi:hypothetical protein